MEKTTALGAVTVRPIKLRRGGSPLISVRKTGDSIRNVRIDLAQPEETMYHDNYSSQVGARKRARLSEESRPGSFQSIQGAVLPGERETFPGHRRHRSERSGSFFIFGLLRPLRAGRKHQCKGY